MTLYASKAEMLGDAVCTAFKKAGIEVVLNHYPLGENECIVDTTEHDKEVRNKTIEEIIDSVDKMNNTGSHCVEDYCEDADSCTDCIAKAILRMLEQMKEGGKDG